MPTLLGVVVAAVGHRLLNVLVVTRVVVFEALLGDVGACGPQMGAGAVVERPASTAADAVPIVVEHPAVGVPAICVAFEDDFVVVVGVVIDDEVGVRITERRDKRVIVSTTVE